MAVKFSSATAGSYSDIGHTRATTRARRSTGPSRPRVSRAAVHGAAAQGLGFASRRTGRRGRHLPANALDGSQDHALEVGARPCDADVVPGRLGAAPRKSARSCWTRPTATTQRGISRCTHDTKTTPNWRTAVDDTQRRRGRPQRVLHRKRGEGANIRVVGDASGGTDGLVVDPGVSTPSARAAAAGTGARR